MHPDTVLMIARETGEKVPYVSGHVTNLIHTHGFGRVVEVDSRDTGSVQLTLWAADTIRVSYGFPARGRHA